MRQDIVDLLRKNKVTMCDPHSCCLCHAHVLQRSYLQGSKELGIQEEIVQQDSPFSYLISVKVLLSSHLLTGKPQEEIPHVLAHGEQLSQNRTRP